MPKRRNAFVPGTPNKANDAVAAYFLATTESEREQAFVWMRGIGWMATRSFYIPTSSWEFNKGELIEQLVLGYAAKWKDLSQEEIGRLAHYGEFRHLGNYVKNRFRDRIRNRFSSTNPSGTAQLSTDYKLESGGFAADNLVGDAAFGSPLGDRKAPRYSRNVFTGSPVSSGGEPQYKTRELLSFIKKELDGDLSGAEYQVLRALVDTYPLPDEAGEDSRSRKGIYTEAVAKNLGIARRKASEKKRSLQEKMAGSASRLARGLRQLLESAPADKPHIPRIKSKTPTLDNYDKEPPFRKRPSNEENGK